MSNQYGYWHFSPSISAAEVGAILWVVTAIITTYQWIRYRAWVWVWVVLAVIMEVISFIARVVSARNTGSRGPYIVQFVLVIIAPVLMAAVFYVVFGRIIFRVLPKQHVTARIIWAPPRWITPIFVTSDVVAFFVQTVGAATIASAQPTDSNFQTKQNQGKDIVLVGLAIQIIFFGFFSIIAVRFHFTGKQLALPEDQLIMHAGGNKRRLKANWGQLLAAVNFGCLCIMARSIYRVIGFAEGTNGYANTEEWTFWVFDFLPVFLAVVTFIVFHPGKYLPHLGFRKPKSLESEVPLPEYRQQRS